MIDREFKLEVLRVTLEHATPAVMADPLSAAQRNLEWCLGDLEQADSPKQKEPARKRKPGQAKAPGGNAVIFT